MSEIWLVLMIFILISILLSDEMFGCGLGCVGLVGDVFML